MILFLCFIQGSTVILSGPGRPPVASITPQNSELVGKLNMIIYLLNCSLFLDSLYVVQYYIVGVFLLVKSFIHHKSITIESFHLMNRKWSSWGTFNLLNLVNHRETSLPILLRAL
jgi:hypothetical protein